MAHASLLEQPVVVHTRPGLQEKMEEHRNNGAQLGWLLDPVGKRVCVYRPGAVVEILENPKTLSGEPLLKGFLLDLPQIWAAMDRKSP